MLMQLRRGGKQVRPPLAHIAVGAHCRWRASPLARVLSSTRRACRVGSWAPAHHWFSRAASFPHTPTTDPTGLLAHQFALRLHAIGPPIPFGRRLARLLRSRHLRGAQYASRFRLESLHPTPYIPLHPKRPSPPRPTRPSPPPCTTEPGFLLDPYLPIFRVNTDDASLQNIEMGSEALAARALAQGKVFQGGNWNHLHRMLKLQTGSALMYVGDHMYSDILRSKRTLGWRTVLMGESEALPARPKPS